ncbi:MAG: hypothetical protein IID46_05025 [Planctomycetes bacterium]|nr:hypothetical protein [Planctomycetota bacterium]
MKNKPIPVLLSMLLCQRVENHVAGCYTLHGVRHIFIEEEYPVYFQGCLSLLLTEVLDGTRLRIEVVDAETETVGLWSDDHVIEALSPVNVVNYTIHLPDFELPKEGKYIIRLFCGEEILGQLPLVAM